MNVTEQRFEKLNARLIDRPVCQEYHSSSVIPSRQNAAVEEPKDETLVLP